MWFYVPFQSILEENVTAIELVISCEVEQMIYSKIDIIETSSFCALLEFCLLLSLVSGGNFLHLCILYLF